jgi:hypothetical protein
MRTHQETPAATTVPPKTVPVVYPVPKNSWLKKSGNFFAEFFFAEFGTEELGLLEEVWGFIFSEFSFGGIFRWEDC